jgi:hypothetical protein
MMLSVVCWKWGTAPFTAAHVNTLRSMLDRHLHLPHRLHCVTDDPTGIDGDVQIVPLEWYAGTLRCRRRMVQYAEWWKQWVGPRSLCLDLDVVLTGDVTPLFDVHDPIKLWKVGYAGVYSGAVQLFDTGILHPLYEMFRQAPEEFPKQAAPRGIGSDQAMLNYYLSVTLDCFDVPHWTEADGIYTFFGAGYERFAHLGVSPTTERLPEGCRLVVMGSDDLRYLTEVPCLAAHYR